MTVDSITIHFNGNIVTLTLSWGEPFNNFDPIVNYTVSCSGDVSCPPNFTTTDNTTRSQTITNLTLNNWYIFEVVATNSVGGGKAGVVMSYIPSYESITGSASSATVITSVGTLKQSVDTYICYKPATT